MWPAVEFGSTSDDSAVFGTPEPDMDYGIDPLLLVTLVIVVTSTIAVVIILLFVRNRKKMSKISTPVYTPLTVQQIGMLFCSQCGQKLAPGSAFCPNCGYRVK